MREDRHIPNPSREELGALSDGMERTGLWAGSEADAQSVCATVRGESRLRLAKSRVHAGGL